MHGVGGLSFDRQLGRSYFHPLPGASAKNARQVPAVGSNEANFILEL